MRGNGISLYMDVLPKITGANKDGFRLVLPSCFCVPLADERAVPIVAQKDGPPDRSPGDRFTPRPVLGDRHAISASR
jgi:hypothetical protein